MIPATPDAPDRLNTLLMRLLGLGCWVSCGLIAAGMAWQVSGMSAGSGADYLVSAGIILLIALPAMRVATMGIWFIVRRDLSFALIAALVLAIIIGSTLLGAGAA